MPTTLTAEQILALAPDPASARAGQGLANARKWATLGCDMRSAWGECQGSAREPYRTQIDLSEPAFRCSCPSRKFPCKHGLGLFNLHPASLIYLPIVVVYLPRSIAQQVKINKFVKADSLPALLGVIPIFNFVQQFDQFGFEAGFLAHFTYGRIFRRFVGSNEALGQLPASLLTDGDQGHLNLVSLPAKGYAPG